jgi:hypothetical protein
LESKTTILDEVIFTFDILGKSDIPMWQICSQVKKNREQNGKDVGDFNCLKSYIRWSILDNSRGRGKNLFTMKVDGKEELVQIRTG